MERHRSQDAAEALGPPTKRGQNEQKA